LKDLIGINGKPPKSNKNEIPELARLEICLMMLMLAQQNDLGLIPEVLGQIKNLISGENKADHLRHLVSESFECVSLMTMLLLLCASMDGEAKTFKEINQLTLTIMLAMSFSPPSTDPVTFNSQLVEKQNFDVF
jgi:hypothetical protein